MMAHASIRTRMLHTHTYANKGTPSQTCLCVFVRVIVGALWLFWRRLRIASSLIAKKKSPAPHQRQTEREGGGGGGCRCTVSYKRRLGGRKQHSHGKRCVAREGGIGGVSGGKLGVGQGRD
jgi:hypothetical protein